MIQWTRTQLKTRTCRLAVHYFTPCHERQLNLPDRAFQRKKLISVSLSVPSSTVASQLAPRLNRVLRSPFAADTPSSRGAAGGKSLTTCPWKQGRGGSHVSYHSTHVKPSVQFSQREDSPPPPPRDDVEAYQCQAGASLVAVPSPKMLLQTRCFMDEENATTGWEQP